MKYKNEIVKPDERLPVRYFYSNDQRPTSVPLHAHNDIEIMYVLTGHVSITAGIQTRYLNSGDITVLNINEIHSIHCQNDYTTAYVIQIPSSYIKFISTLPTDAYFKIPILSASLSTLNAAAKEQLSLLQTTIADFFQLTKKLQEDPYLYIAAQGILCEIIYQLFRHFLDASAKENLLNHRDFERILSIEQYMKHHYYENISLEDISAHFNLSPSYFSRYFRQVFGIPFSKHLQSIRLQKAYSDLISTNRPLTYIAETNGFSCYSLFNAKFKEAYGCTPSCCRKKYYA